VRVYHTSSEKIKNITKSGRFGDCLFFSSEVYQMNNSAIYTYSIELKNAIEVSRFFYDDNCDKLDSIVESIMNIVECDKETAENLLDESVNIFNIIDDCEIASEYSWTIQGMQGEAARLLGYDSAESEDEQGTVYIVSMSGREKELVLNN